MSNAIVATFENVGEVFLVNTQTLDAVNYPTIARFLLDSIDKVSTNRYDFLVCITDGTSYMKKAVQGLAVLLPKLVLT